MVFRHKLLNFRTIRYTFAGLVSMFLISGCGGCSTPAPQPVAPPEHESPESPVSRIPAEADGKNVPVAGTAPAPVPRTSAPVEEVATTEAGAEADTGAETPARDPELELQNWQKFAAAIFQLQRLQQLKPRSFQQELGLTPAQVSRIRRLQQELLSLTMSLIAVPAEESIRQLQTRHRTTAEQWGRQLDEILTADQNQSLYQAVIRHQEGAVVFLMPGMPERLSLTAQQRDEVVRQLNATRDTLDFSKLYDPWQWQKLRSRAAEARQAAERQLTPEQARIFQSIVSP